MKQLTILLLLLLCFNMMILAQDEIEYGEVIETEIGRNGDEYVFEGEEGDIISIRMFSEELDTVLRLYNEDGDEIAQSDDAFMGTNSLIGLVLPEDGEYTISAEDYFDNRDEVYTLWLNLLDESYLLDYGTEASGRVSDDYGEVWVFEGEEGDVITINMDSNIIDSYLELFNPRSGLLTSNDDSGRTRDSEITNFELPEDGSYFIVARSFASNSNGVYTIRIEAQSGTVASDSEASLEYGDTVSGDIEDTDGDTWTFEGEEDDWVLIAMSNPSTDCFLELYNSDGRQLVRDDDSGIGYNAAILYELPDDDEYTIIARAYSGQTGSYQMSLSLAEDLEELVYISIVNNNSVNLRDGAGSDSHVVDSTYVGDIILLVGRSEDNEWLQLVSLEDEPRWIAARFTEVYDIFGTSDDLDDLPVTD